MSIPDNGSSRGSVKTLAIRLEPDLHAQLSLIAQLRGSTITDEIRAAIESHIAAVKADATLAGRADDVLESIERDANARRGAIATLFGSQPTAVTETITTQSPTASRTRGGRSDRKANEGGPSAT